MLANGRAAECGFHLVMIEIFLKGGPVMWPLLAVSLVAVTVVFERLFFTGGEGHRGEPAGVARIFAAAERRDLAAACAAGAATRDFVARVLTYALEHREVSFGN